MGRSSTIGSGSGSLAMGARAPPALPLPPRTDRSLQQSSPFDYPVVRSCCPLAVANRFLGPPEPPTPSRSALWRRVGWIGDTVTRHLYVRGTSARSTAREENEIGRRGPMSDYHCRNVTRKGMERCCRATLQEVDLDQDFEKDTNDLSSLERMQTLT